MAANGDGCGRTVPLPLRHQAIAGSDRVRAAHTPKGVFTQVIGRDDLQSSGSRNLQPSTIKVLGFAAIVSFVIGLMFAASNYDALVSMFLGVGLIVVSLPALSREADREKDSRLFWLLVIALVVKLVVGAVGQLYVINEAYGGVADANGYFDAGWTLARHFRQLNFETGFTTLIGTNFAKLLTGIVLTVIGSAKTGAFMFFSWMGFWGLFLFYRAFVIAVPEGRSRSYARLVFFLPSLVFWPSAIGKDAWMVLAVGIATFGCARILTGHIVRGLVITGIGMWMTAMIRPYMGAMLGLGLAAAYIVRPPREDLRELAPVAKAIALIVLMGVALVVVGRSERFLQDRGFQNPTDINSSLGNLQQRTYTGGSSFVPSLLTSPRRAPAAVFTVVFRPVLTDAEKSQEYIAGLEGTLLLLFVLARTRWIIAALRSVRRQPFVALAVVYTGLFVLGFSSIANFGILVRQRSSMLPLLLVVLCIPPRKKLLEASEEPNLARATSSRA